MKPRERKFGSIRKELLNRVQSIQDALDEQAAREYGRWQADLQNPATVIDAENSGPS